MFWYFIMYFFTQTNFKTGYDVESLLLTNSKHLFLLWMKMFSHLFWKGLWVGISIRDIFSPLSTSLLFHPLLTEANCYLGIGRYNFSLPRAPIAPPSTPLKYGIIFHICNPYFFMRINVRFAFYSCVYFLHKDGNQPVRVCRLVRGLVGWSVGWLVGWSIKLSRLFRRQYWIQKDLSFISQNWIDLNNVRDIYLFNFRLGN